MRNSLAIAIILVVIFLVGCSAPVGVTTAVGAAPTAPNWPADVQAYFQEADRYRVEIIVALPAFWVGPGATIADVSLDSEQARQAGDRILGILRAVGDLEAPPVLLPYHRAVILAAAECSRSVNNAARLTDDNPDGAATTLAIIILRNQCIDTLNLADLESARYAASAGGFPANE